jgi:C4-dicarboxylate transporter/malic acid transport protein
MIRKDENGNNARDPSATIRFTDRLEHFTWANFTLTMSTGGLTLLLGSEPHAFHGLLTIGKIVYIFDLVLFVLVCSAITYRFIRFPGTFKHSLVHPTESLFVPTLFLSLASMIAAIAIYGIPATGHWLVEVYIVLFWLYFAVTFIAAVAQYYYLFSRPQFTIQGMIPSWILPIFPFMLSGTVSSSGAGLMSPHQAMPVIVGGLTAQGLGMLVAFLMYAQYIRRLLQFGLPSPNMRPSMFISVGPPAFTSLAIIGLADDFPAGETYFGDPAITQQVVKIMATFTAIFMWCLAFWFFAIAVIACLGASRSMSFHLSWWAFVFPNVGFTIAGIRIGHSLQSEGILWVGTTMTIMLVMVYLFVLVSYMRAVCRKQIWFPGKDEDVQHSDPGKVKGVDEEARMHKHE